MRNGAGFLMGPNIEIKELPRTEKDRLDEELFWINLSLAEDSIPKNSDEVIKLTKRKKEIEARFKLIALEDDF